MAGMISVTSLSGYLYCSRKLYLERVLGIFEIPKEVVVKGTIRHAVYDEINKTEESTIKSIKKRIGQGEIQEIYKNAYSRILRTVILNKKNLLKSVLIKPEDMFRQTWPIILGESETRAENIFRFMEEHDIYGEELWARLTPKIESEFRIESPTLGLRGIIDQIERYENLIVPVELKTGKMPEEGVWPGHKIQVGAYALLLEEKTGKKVSIGKVRYLDSGEERTVAMNPFVFEEVRELTKKVQELLKSHQLPKFCGNDNKCLACGLREKCRNNQFIENEVKRRFKAS